MCVIRQFLNGFLDMNVFWWSKSLLWPVSKYHLFTKCAEGENLYWMFLLGFYTNLAKNDGKQFTTTLGTWYNSNIKMREFSSNF